MAEPQETRADREAMPHDPQDANYHDLHAERARLEEALKLLQQRQQFGGDADEVASARLEEGSMLRELDRVLTLIRAAEIRRRPGARRWN